MVGSSPGSLTPELMTVAVGSIIRKQTYLGFESLSCSFPSCMRWGKPLQISAAASVKRGGRIVTGPTPGLCED